MGANIFVFFTANDAYLRDYRTFVPEDCVASNTAEENQHALGQMAGARRRHATLERA